MESSMGSLEGTENLGLAYNSSVWCVATPPKWTAAVPQPLSATSVKGSGEVKYSWGGRTWSCAPGCSFCLEGEMSRHTITYWFMVCGHVRSGVWLGRVMIGKLVWRRGMRTDCSEWVKNVRISMSYVNAHWRVIPAKEDFNFNNQVGRMTLWIWVSLFPLSQSCHCPMGSWIKRPGWQGWMLCMGSATRTFIHQGQLGYGHCWVSNLPAAETNTKSLIGYHSPGWSTNYLVDYTGQLPSWKGQWREFCAEWSDYSRLPRGNWTAVPQRR